MLAFDTFEYYNVEEYLSCVCLEVDPNYGQFGISKELLSIVEKICWTFSIELSSFLLTSPEMDHLAGKEKFHLDKGLRYSLNIYFIFLLFSIY